MANEPYLAGIFLFAGNFAPRGYMFCQGQLISIAQNTALFSLLGTSFGGDGITTFALPDLRGRVPVGTGTGSGLANVTQGEQGGNQNVTLTTNQMPAHIHPCTVTIYAANDGRASVTSPVGAVLDSGTDTIYAPTPDGTQMNAGMATAQVGIAGGNQPFPVQNPYLGLNFIIATQGLFPSRN